MYNVPIIFVQKIKDMTNEFFHEGKLFLLKVAKSCVWVKSVTVNENNFSQFSYRPFNFAIAIFVLVFLYWFKAPFLLLYCSSIYHNSDSSRSSSLLKVKEVEKKLYQKN